MNRVIPSFVEDEDFDLLSANAEIFFRRLWNEADDLGRMNGNLKILKSRLYPLKDIRMTDISHAIQECENARLIAYYDIKNKPYIQILRFWNQKLARSKPKYPPIPPKLKLNCDSIDTQLKLNCDSIDTQLTLNCGAEEEEEYEEETNKEKVKKESAEEIYAAYPRKVAKPNAIKAILKALCKIAPDELLAKTKAYAKTVAEWSDEDKNYIPHPATWFNQERYNDNPETWERQNNGNRNYIGHTRKDVSNNQGSCNNSADYSRAYLEEY